jgi:hypothetical protein
LRSARAGQLHQNRHPVVRNSAEGLSRGGGARWLDARTVVACTFVIEQTIDPTTWLIVTGWNATDAV